MSRCPPYGSIPSLVYRDSTPHCFSCSTHPALHKLYGRFNPRCALCWSNGSSALAHSAFVCMWRATRKLRAAEKRP